MHNKMIDKLKTADAAERKRRTARYAEILALGDAASAEQISELQTLLAALGFDTSKAEADARAIGRRAEMQKLLADAPAREKAKLAAFENLKRFNKEMERTIARLSEEKRQLIGEANEKERLYFAAARCERMLAELNLANAELFGLEQPARQSGPTLGYVAPSPFRRGSLKAVP